MKSKYYLIFILILCFSCVGKGTKYKSPQGTKHFSAKKTCDILYDLHIADALINTKNFQLSNNNMLEDTILYEYVYDKYSCTRKEFYESFLFHTQNNIDSLNYYYEKNIEKMSEKQSLLEENK